MSGPNYRRIWVKSPKTEERVKIYLHVYLWLNYHGFWRKGQTSPPAGHEIHHKDFDPLNNELGNLQLVTFSEHKRLHWERDRETKINSFKKRMESITPEKWEASQKKKSASLKKYWATVAPGERKRRADVARAGHRKLTDEDVREIRRLYVKRARGKVGELCQRFNISRQHIRAIVSRKLFPNVN